MKRSLWTKEELIVTFNLYLKIPFSKISARNPQVKELAKILNRSDNSIALRLVNFASCDPLLQERGIKGMRAGIKICQPIWDEFANDKESLLFESEQILAKMQNQTLENKYNILLKDISLLKGETKAREIKTRVNQNLFREIVLANYTQKCAITGIDIPELLVASHIIPWANNEKERMNPENGICLSALYDKAFDKGFISFDNDYKVLLSNKLKKHCEKIYFENLFKKIDKKQIIMPQSYLPNKEFLEWHRDCIFDK